MTDSKNTNKAVPTRIYRGGLMMIDKSDNRPRIRLRTFITWVLIPLCLLACVSTIPLSKSISDIRNFATTFKEQMLPTMVQTQTTFVNLEALDRATNELSHTNDTERARIAYVDSIAILLESFYDKPPHIYQMIRQLAEDVHLLWRYRNKYDEDRQLLFEEMRKVFLISTRLHMATNTLPDNATQLRASRTLFDINDFSVNFRHLKERLIQFILQHEELCSINPTPETEKLCRDLYVSRFRIEALLTRIDISSHKMTQKAEQVREQKVALTAAMTSAEIDATSSKFRQLEDWMKWGKYMVAFLGLFFIFLASLLFVSMSSILMPLMQLANIGNTFRKFHSVPSKMPHSIIYEIHQIIEIMKIFFDDIRRKQREKEELVSRNAILSNENQRDALTGLSNRRFLENYAKLHSGSAVLMFDIDHFKNINDNFGHLFGDKVLKTVAGAIRNNLHRRDTVCRWGGEEFCVILHYIADPDDAYHIGQRVLDVIAGTSIRTPEGKMLRVTVSCGASKRIAEDEVDTVTLTNLIAQADEALYRAKNNGRCQVQVHGKPTIPQK